GARRRRGETLRLGDRRRHRPAAALAGLPRDRKAPDRAPRADQGVGRLPCADPLARGSETRHQGLGDQAVACAPYRFLTAASGTWSRGGCRRWRPDVAETCCQPEKTERVRIEHARCVPGIVATARSSDDGATHCFTLPDLAAQRPGPTATCATWIAQRRAGYALRWNSPSHSTATTSRHSPLSWSSTACPSRCPNRNPIRSRPRAALLCADLKANDIVVLDLARVSDATDYFLIASGSSDTHVRAIAEHVLE